ncbi:hypothetical protein HK14_12770 [Acetobacter cibinongensis]|uniref:Uncharacterized protein n=1 Tax=Acetobacter cibinongensis TaxID=146475 RepID=A0A1Z5YRV5_9PROT|nr:hypothetical protein HK14_12770 [Acetobacter cibinongensis]
MLATATGRLRQEVVRATALVLPVLYCQSYSVKTAEGFCTIWQTPRVGQSITAGSPRTIGDNA